MNNSNGIHILQQLRRRWVIQQLFIHALLAIAIALITGAVLYTAFQFSVAWVFAVFTTALLLLIWWRNPWQFTNAAAARFLNRQYPQLEESTALILKPSPHLTLLERLQQHKVTDTLQGLAIKGSPFARRMQFAFIYLAVAIVCSLLITYFPVQKNAGSAGAAGVSSQVKAPAEAMPPQVEEVQVTVTPPAYTHKPAYTQQKFTLNLESGSVAKWQLVTNTAVHQLSLVLNGKTRLPLHTAGSSQTHWYAQALFTASGFYQVDAGGKLSEPYQIQMIRDTPPVIRIKTPKPYTYIDAGEAPRVLMSAVANDDYGIAEALLVATVAKGSGEGVKFKEYRMPFGSITNGNRRQYQLKKLFDLPSFQMEPGDELYFYLQALDTHRQQSRTDVYKITLQDTAQLLSMDGIVSGSNLKPEFFRSQRQIIIDTEGLLKAKDSISTAEYNNRCNTIATDQKLLRLRYGKFLGEEDEGKIGEAEGSDLDNVENFNNAAKIMDAYTDKHDNAEDATFFEPAIKTQLKATLNEMWRAELQLRLYKPSQALPYEYKALRLLKDLQQKSRAYVAKTNYNPPPIKPDKRLSGDLSKISSPVSRYDQKVPADALNHIKQAVGILAELAARPRLNIAQKQILLPVLPQLNQYAAVQGGNYIKAAVALRRLLSNPAVTPGDVQVIAAALQQMLPLSKTLPHPSPRAADMNLGKSYYQHLNRLNR